MEGNVGITIPKEKETRKEWRHISIYISCQTFKLKWRILLGTIWILKTGLLVLQDWIQIDSSRGIYVGLNKSL